MSLYSFFASFFTKAEDLNKKAVEEAEKMVKSNIAGVEKDVKSAGQYIARGGSQISEDAKNHPIELEDLPPRNDRP